MRLRLLAAALVLPLLACSDDGGDTSSDAAGDGAAQEDAHDAGGDIAEAGPAEEEIDGVIAYRITSNDHIAGEIAYPVSPPPGGPHNEVWVSCGFHEEPFEDENLVHDLEHGAIWLAYSPDLDDADLEVLRSLADEHKVIAAPYDGLAEGEAVVATAWARQLRLDSVDDERLLEFVEQYADGPQAPEAGVTCTGTPLG